MLKKKASKLRIKTRTITYPNEEQDAIINAVLNQNDKIVLVDACPGSGKTTLLVDIFQKCVDTWTYPGGIACISFTNVAQKNIKEKLGGIIPSRHFVGTFDSFIYNFIVKPYGHLLGYVNKNGLQIIEHKYEFSNYKYKYQIYCNKTDSDEKQYVQSALEIEFISEINRQPLCIYKAPDKYISNWAWNHVIKERKEDLWQKGIANYSDIKFLALELLRHPSYGNHIIQVLNRKFPYLFVDELQDTGYYLEEILQLLLSGIEKAFLIGDSDQAIYNFAGANARIFDVINSKCKKMPLTNSFRCQSNITDVINVFSVKGSTIQSDNNISQNNYLIIHDYKVNFNEPCANLKQIISDFSQNCDSLAILARRGTIANKFRNNANTKCELSKSKMFGQRINSVLNAYYTEDRVKNWRSFEKILGELFFQTSNPTEIRDAVLNNNICMFKWKRTIFILINELHKTILDESWNDWLDRVKRSISELGLSLGLSNVNLSGKFNKDKVKGGKLRTLPDKNIEEWTRKITKIDSIHGVKGEEFDGVIVFWGKPENKDYGKCPSELWWDDLEEKRIIFVATSRARKKLAVCIHKDTYEKIKQNEKQKAILKYFKEIIIHNN